MTTELQLSQDVLSKLNGLATSYNEGVGGEGQSFPQLTLVNKAGDQMFGKWVLGRKLVDGELVETGEIVERVIILAAYNQYSYYNNDAKKRCRSQQYLMHNEGLFGNTYKNKCGGTCPMRQREGSDKCKGVRVVYGLAETADGRAPFVSYIRGMSMFPFNGYLKKLVAVGNGSAPMFAFWTELSSHKEKNGATVYFVGDFERGEMLDWDDIKALAPEADSIHKGVKMINEKSHGNGATGDSNIVPDKEIVGLNRAKRVSDMNEVDDLPFNPASSSNSLLDEVRNAVA